MFPRLRLLARHQFIDHPDGNRLPTSSTYYDLLFCKLTSSQCNNLPIETLTTISWPRKSLATLLPLNTTACSTPTRLSIQITLHDTMLVRSKLWVVDLMAQRWSIFLNTTDFYLSVDRDQGNQMLDQPRHSILDILNWHYPAWKTNQHLYAFTNRSTPALPIAPHPDTSETGLVVRIQSIPQGHRAPTFSHRPW